MPCGSGATSAADLDGSRFWADGVLVLLRDELGQARGFAKITRDDTARRMTEDRLREHLGLTETITGNLLEGINVLDRAGRITFANRAALEMLGYEAEEPLGRGQHETSHSVREDGTPHPAEESQSSACCARASRCATRRPLTRARTAAASRCCARPRP